MKKILIIILLFATSLVKSQVNSSVSIPDSLIIQQASGKYGGINQIQATCASPSGGMNTIAAPPPSYAWLQTNGYCNPASYGSSGTVCWSFVPTGNTVTINSGYSTTGCAIISFGPFTLFTCFPACTNMGAGLSFSVTPGQCYTWCMGYSGVGGGCSFNDFCPYYQQSTILPIGLLYFAGSNQGRVNILQWKTATETQNSHFIVEVSYNAQEWNELTQINGAGNSHYPIEYKHTINEYNKSVNYYRLKQVDYDGTYKYHGIIAIDNSNKSEDVKIISILNVFGQQVNEDYRGVQFLYYSNGSVEKKIVQ